MKFLALFIIVLSISCSAQPIVSQNVPYDGTTTDMKCTIPSPALIMPIASADEFMGIVEARAQYSRSILVHVLLAAQVFDFQNSLPPVLGNTMACTYIFGPGSTLIANSSSAVLQIFGARDIVVSDIAVDRYFSAYNGPLEDCQRNRTSSSSCTALLSASQNGNAANVVQVSGSDRITILRLKTEGGVSFINSLSVRLLSSNVSSVGGYGVFVQGSRGDATVRNNSISAPWGSGIALSQQLVANTFITNNVVSGCGSSCISLRRSMLTTVEFNQCINFSVVAGNSAAGFYQLNGMGWRNLGVVVRNNFFSAPLQNCFWFADYTSNVAFTSNICATGGSRFVGGRFNRFANNLWVWSRNRTGTLGDISCINRAPNTWATCSSYLTNNVEPDLTFLTTEVWANVFPNGSRKYLPDYTGFYTDLVPQYAYNTWCSPTAGANNISCVSPNTTYSLNGTTYTLPCEALPSENFFGFTIVHLSGFVPAAFRAAANCACRGSACGNFANAWPNYTIDAISIVNQINYVNVTYFKLDQNTFGRNLTLTSIDLRQLRILPNSTLAVQAPKLLEIPIDSIGFDNGASAAPATAAPMYRLPPTQQPPDIVDSPYGAPPVANPVDGPNTPPFVQPIASSTPADSPTPSESPSASVPSIGGSPLLSLAPSPGAPSNLAPSLTANGHPQEAPVSSPIEMISPLPNESISSNQVVIGASSAAAAIVAIVLVIIIILLVRRKKVYADIGSIDVPKGLSSMFNIKTSEIEVRNKIGEGSFGAVFACSYKGETVALKKLSAPMISARVGDFFREATTMIGIKFHPNIVQIYGLCQEPSNFSLVMEYMPNGNLEDLAAKQVEKGWDPNMLFKITLGVARGMAHLAGSIYSVLTAELFTKLTFCDSSEEGIVHRDLAARNILLSADFQPKISDFGMSRMVAGEVTEGQTNSTVGPIKWMPPESLRDRIYSEKSDVWSFGVIIWEATTATYPFEGEDLLQVALEVRDSKRTVLTDASSDTLALIPAYLQEIMELCFQRDPRARPTFAELVDQLEAHTPPGYVESTTSRGKSKSSKRLSTHSQLGIHSNSEKRSGVTYSSMPDLV